MDLRNNKEAKDVGKKVKSVSFSASLGEPTNDVVSANDIAIPKMQNTLWPNPIHYLLILNALYAKGLTLNPLQWMIIGVPILAVMQLLYGSVLLTSSVTTLQDRTVKDSKLLIVITSTFAALLIANVLFVVMVLMGAPIATLVLETYTLSLHISLLAIQPVLVLFRLEHEHIRALFSADNVTSKVISNPVLCSAVAAIIGAWLGVIPIPLDWDRPWQQWPLTILTGAYIGSFIGHNVAVIKTLLG